MQKLNPLLTFIFAEDVTDPPACPEQEALYGYIDAEFDLGTASAQARFPALTVHLAQCQSCQQEADDLTAVLQTWREAELVRPRIEAEFDFSYLEREQASSKGSIWHEVTRARQQVTELLTKITIVLSEGQAFFEQLPSLLTPQWQTMPMASRSRGQELKVPVLWLPSPQHDLSVRLDVYPPEQGETAAALNIKVIQLSSEQPVRARVALRDYEYRLLQSRSTNHQEGEVRFANVEPDSYVVEVKYRGKVLQLPIVVNWPTTTTAFTP